MLSQSIPHKPIMENHSPGPTSNLFPGQALSRSLLQLLGRKGWAHWGFEIKQTACLADSCFFMDWSAGGIVEAGWLLVCCIHVSEEGKFPVNPLRTTVTWPTLGWAIHSLLLLLLRYFKPKSAFTMTHLYTISLIYKHSRMIIQLYYPHPWAHIS